MALFPARLLLGPCCLSQSEEERLKSKLGLKEIAGFYLHVLHFKSEYGSVDSEKRRLIDEKIENLLDHYPWLLRFSRDDPAYTTISNLRKVSSSKATYEELEVELKKALGSDAIVCWVVSRPGLVTGWASKASGLLFNTDLTEYVTKVEKGFVYVLKAAGDLSEKREKLEGALIDAQLFELFLDRIPQSSCLKITQEFNPRPLRSVTLPSDFHKQAPEERHSFFSRLDKQWDLNLGSENLQYLVDRYMDKWSSSDAAGECECAHSFTDAELYTLSQVNSDHCRHLTFNSTFVIDGVRMPMTLFEMIKNTYKKNSSGVISAYKDNGAILEGHKVFQFFPSPVDKIYRMVHEDCHMVMKAETHNHPTAIEPHNGAATGVGGEIRDEAACGAGGKPLCGFTGFILSNLNIPDFTHCWESPFHLSLNENYSKQWGPFTEEIKQFYSRQKPGKPFNTSLSIIIKAPLGSSHYSNEFGRPVLSGFFRTYTEAALYKNRKEYSIFGYHKPLVLCGGTGTIRHQNVIKGKIRPGDVIMVLGEPAILVGLGGSSTSSGALADGSKNAASSVQRANAEAERICQSVIDACTAYGNNNPIVSIHDVGAGGLSNALSELVNDSEVGISVDLRSIPLNDETMSPMEILCTESQERYVLAVRRENVDMFRKICLREKCNFGCVGVATEQRDIVVYDKAFDEYPVRISSKFLFKENGPNIRSDISRALDLHDIRIPSAMNLEDIACNILRVPAVASKSFLITIGDRSITGLVSRDQMVGPWQVPVADAAVTFMSYKGHKGSAMALGERPLISLIDPAASARMAVGEAVTNILSADVKSLRSIKLCANWMADANTDGMKVSLYKAVKSIGIDLCPDLGMCIPVGKDSMSMSMSWRLPTSSLGQGTSNSHTVVSPVTAVISAYAPVGDVRRSLTPQLADEVEATVLVFVDLASGKMRLGGSCLSQILNAVGRECPDVSNPNASLIPFAHFMEAIRCPNSGVGLLAYHDRSDGGLFTTLVEMCFSGNKGCIVDISHLGDDNVSILFNEELGVVLQVRKSEAQGLLTIAKDCGLNVENIHIIGDINDSDRVTLTRGCDVLLDMPISALYKIWTQTSYHIQSLRGNAECANSEYLNIDRHFSGKGLSLEVTFDLNELKDLPLPPTLLHPLRVAVLRENGSNGHMELAYSFQSVGFEVHDLTMFDVTSGNVNLLAYSGIGFPGGFSNGDVLGSGAGWAKTILMNTTVRSKFKEFFERSDKFTIGICNGCQLLAYLRDIIPGTTSWPLFVQNESRSFEARLCKVRIEGETNSIFLKGMARSIMTVPIAHGEGRALFLGSNKVQNTNTNPVGNNTALTYVDNEGRVAVGKNSYPYNPSGTAFGIAGVSSDDGRVLGIMPHPERSIRMYQNNWGFDKTHEHSSKFSNLEWSPWIKIFLNSYNWARKFSV